MEVDKCLHQTCTADLENHCVLQEDGLVFLNQNYGPAKDHHTLFYDHRVMEVVVLIVETLVMDVVVLQIPAACAFQLCCVFHGKVDPDVDERETLPAQILMIGVFPL
jgi:hypothetical protein